MDDIGSPPFDSKEVEFWIHRELKSGKQSDYIADELLKRWGKRQFTVAAKQSTGTFCIDHGYHASLFKLFKIDLAQGQALPWGVLIESFLNPENFLSISTFGAEMPKELTDAFLTGATRDKQLHVAAAAALRGKDA